MGFASLYPSYEDMFPHSRGMICPRLELQSSPSQVRGRREDRVHAAPAVSRAFAHLKTRTRAYRFSGSIPAFPAQWLYGLLRALPSERLFCHCRRARREPLRSLTPAPRRQDHTTSPYASCALVFCAIRVHRISPRVRDDGQRPSSAVRRADSITDLPDGASGIFSREGMDRLLVICPSS